VLLEIHLKKLSMFLVKRYSFSSYVIYCIRHYSFPPHCIYILGVFTSTGVTGYKGIRVTFCNVFKWRKVTLIPLYPVTPVLVNTPIIV